MGIGGFFVLLLGKDREDDELAGVREQKRVGGFGFLGREMQLARAKGYANELWVEWLGDVLVVGLVGWLVGGLAAGVFGWFGWRLVG